VICSACVTHTSQAWKDKYIHGFTFGLHELSPGQLLDDETPFFTRNGDVNQEDITNNAVSAWNAIQCWHFSLTDNPGIDHFSLPSDPSLLARLIADANAPRSSCR